MRSMIAKIVEAERFAPSRGQAIWSRLFGVLADPAGRAGQDNRAHALPYLRLTVGTAPSTSAL
jgi:hypothetical protein